MMSSPSPSIPHSPPQPGPPHEDVAADYAALVQSAGLVDLGPRTHVELAGPDAAAFLNRFATNKMDDLGPGTGREAFLTDAKGHVLSWILAFARAEGLTLDADSDQAGAIIAHLDFYRIREKLEFRDRSAAWREMLLAGPQADRLLAGLAGGCPGRSHLSHVHTLLAGWPVSLRRIDLGRESAFLVCCEGQAAQAVRDAICRAGARCCGAAAWEAVRIESGWPQYGRDITPENLPQEVGRDDRAISFHKGCYLGQETVARLDARGHVNRTLRGLRFDTREVPPDKTELTCGDQPAGRVTSAAYSPGMGTAVALAYVRRAYDAPSTRLDSPLGPAQIQPLPMRRP